MSIDSQPLRADAERNRQRLLEAASELFAERGLTVTLNDIAHHAGVGVGTAYRRFPNKEAVVDALFEQRLQEVAAIARTALEKPDAWEGLVTFLQGSLDLQFGDRGLAQIMNNTALGATRVNDARDQIAPLITQLVERAKEQGTVRPDLDQTDLVFIQQALASIIDSTRNLAPDLFRRYLVVFLDGIRAFDRGFSKLPVAALTANEAHLVMTQARNPQRRSEG